MLLLPQGNTFVNNILSNLAEYYNPPGVEEVAINRPEEIWVKMKGGDWEAKKAEKLSYKYLFQVCRVLANINQSRFSEDDLPVVSCEMPNAPFRFQGIMGPNVRYETSDQRGVAIAIRSLVAQTMEFSRWGLTSEAKLEGAAKFFQDFAGMDDHIARLQKVIDTHQTIIISGMTSTGKTTFTNRIISLIDQRARVITVEDTRELTVPHPNRLHLMIPRNRGTNQFSWNTAIDALMRLTPDWVVCGELSVSNADTIYSLMGKGHPVITTVHAGNPEEALRAFINNMASSGSTHESKSTLENLESQVGCIIQLNRLDGQRKVTDIAFPANLRHRETAVRSALREMDVDLMAKKLSEEKEKIKENAIEEK